jgi:acid phosphatase (class A)
MALDEALNRQILTLRGTARWKLAARDAIPDPGGVFSCALGLPITKQETPSLFTLLRRSVVDVGAAVTPTKKFYQRKRPFLVNKQPICVPGSEDATARNGSYPSGHTASGWVWALILAELAPDKTDAVLSRGWEFGQSRAVCNVHWQSDVTQGRTVGAALFARLHANANFRADLKQARVEIAAVRTKGLTPNRDCEAEVRTLTIGAPTSRVLR